MLSAPSPSPNLDAALDGAGRGIDWATFGPLLAAVLVGLLTLGGVIWSSMYRARQDREAEDLRHDNAIKAEDHRHALSLKAEERRHQLAIALERDHRTAETRHELYVRIEDARRQLVEAVGLPDSWRSQAPVSPEHREILERRLDVVDDRALALRKFRAEASLYGTGEVSAGIGLVSRASINLSTVVALTVSDSIVALTPPGTAERPLMTTREAAEKVRETCTRLLAQMRLDLGVDRPERPDVD